jgi:hypothetical protein
MRYIINILFLFTLITTSLFSNEEIESKELYLEYTSFPQRVFTGQKFEVKLKALILKDETSYDKIITSFTHEDNLERLTTDVVWIKNKLSEYTTSITYKVFKDSFALPKITLALSKNEEIIDFISIDSPAIKYEQIALNQKLFSNVIAKEFEVMTAKTKQYTNNILHTTINVKAVNSNLEDFKLNTYPSEDQGINSLTDTYPEQNLYYYVMIPSHTKEINFNYYNVDAKDFVMINIPIMLDEELVSTQTELNPYNSSILVYKQIFSAAVLFVFIVLFAFTKNNIYLIIITILIIVLAYLFIPNKKILLDKGINVYILPTSNSTLFKSIEHKKVVEIVNENSYFIKVLFDNESIGWIKKNDI